MNKAIDEQIPPRHSSSRQVSLSTLSIGLISVMVLALTGCEPPKEKKTVAVPAPPPVPAPDEIRLPDGTTFVLGGKKSPKDEAEKQKDEDLKRRARSCVESICQLPTSIYYAVDNKATFLDSSELALMKTAGEVFEKEIWPTLDQRIQKDHAENKDTNSKLTQLASRIPTTGRLEVDEATRVIMSYFIAVRELEKLNFEEDLDLEHYQRTHEIRLKESVKARLADEERQRLETAMKILSRSNLEFSGSATYSILEKFGFRAFLLYAYPGQEIEVAQRKLAEQTQEHLSLLKEKSPLLYQSSFSNPVVQKILRAEAVLPAEEASLKDSLSNLALFHALLKNPWKELEVFYPDVDLRLDADRVRKSMESYKGRYTEQALSERFLKSREKTFKTCYGAISSHLATRPTAEQIAESQRVIQQVRETSKAVAREIFSSEIKTEELNRVIDRANFKMATDWATSLKELKESAQVIAGLESSAEIDVAALSSAEGQSLLALVGTIAEGKQEEPDSQFTTISNFCMSYFPIKLSDFSLTVDNRISVSETTVKAGARGAGIIAHELSHRLHQDLGMKAHSSILSCLADRHRTPVGMQETVYIRHLHEDFADHFSSKVLERLRLTTKEYNLGCLLIEKFSMPNIKGTFISWGNSEHPMFSSYNEKHSAPVFRLIQIAQDLGHSTAACQKFAQEESQKSYTMETGQTLMVPEVKQCRKEEGFTQSLTKTSASAVSSMLRTDSSSVPSGHAN